MDLRNLLDSTGRRILRALQADARLSFSELGRQVGLSQPAAAERVRRMEAAGLITGYHAELSADLLGAPLLAIIRLVTPPERYPRFLKAAAAWPEVLECHHVSGPDSFVLQVRASSPAHLEELVGRLSPYGETNTAIVLSSPIPRRPPPVPPS